MTDWQRSALPTFDDLRELLDLSPRSARTAELLSLIGFRDTRAAEQRLERLAGEARFRAQLARVLPAFLLAVAETAQPDLALINLERLAAAVSDRGDLYGDLASNPRAVEILVRLFVGSPFLTEIVLGNPAYLDRLTRQKRLAEIKSVQQLQIEAQGALIGVTDAEEALDALRRFQRWELLRIGTCDFFGLLDLRRVTVQLSLLAEALVRACFNLAIEAARVNPAGFVVIALGKLGGEELNYSSDIDLLFVADAATPAHARVCQRLIRGLSEATSAGFMYRVDMRLRPWGNSGELVTSLEAHLTYLAQHARLWEKQALLKARVVAGDAALGQLFLKRASPMIFSALPDQAREAVRGMKQKIESELAKKGRLWGEVKLGSGSIRDVEFLVQYLQLIHGGAEPAVRSFNTLDALVRLADLGFLHADEYRVLTDGYVFLRGIEHALQLAHNKQVHELPRDETELVYLARRLDFETGPQFVAHYERHRQAVRSIYERYLGQRDKASEGAAGPKQQPVARHLARLKADYSETFSEPDIERHAQLALKVNDAEPVIVEAASSGDLWRVTIVGYDFLGELSLICGLFLIYGLDIVEGQVFTYDAGPAAAPAPAPRQSRPAWLRPEVRRGRTAQQPALPAQADARAKIVDVFTVRPTRGPVSAADFQNYAMELAACSQQFLTGRAEEAQGALARRAAASLRSRAGQPAGTLYPIDIAIDNETSEEFTILTIGGRDTIGFLYELTNALALSGVSIARMRVASRGSQVHDTLYVTDAQGQKITDPARKRELSVATALIKQFTHLLPHSPNPESALLHFREFLAQLFSSGDWAAELASLERPQVLEAMARLLGASDFLWNDFLRMQHANLFPVLSHVEELGRPRPAEELASALEAALARAGTTQARHDTLNAFKDREMFRVDMRHILGLIPDFTGFSEELGDVAEVVVRAAVELCHSELLQAHGQPLLQDGSRCAYSVCALGKCGGRELGFASDIELMFLYAGEGSTAGPQVITSAEFYIKLVDRVTRVIRAHREGIFEIDLRLRPYGRAGSLAVTLEAFEHYFAPEGPAWPYERQALVKLRPIAGDAELGLRIAALRDRLIYTQEPFDVAAMRGMRERQLRQLVAPHSFNAKLSQGGLVDVEYLVQGLQITHGAAHPAVRSANTLAALAALEEAGLLCAEMARRLREAYIFFRKLIGALRIVRGNAKDLAVPAESSEEYAYLSRRLNYEEPHALQTDLDRHVADVRELSRQLLG
jgi:glutamate-ammonia-ligase adenylyltransferase